MNFNYFNSKSYTLSKRQQIIHSFVFSLFKVIVYMVGIASLLAVLASLLGLVNFNRTILGLILIILSLSLLVFIIEIFLRATSKILANKPISTLNNDVNLADYLDKNLSEIFNEAYKIALANKIQTIGTPMIILASSKTDAGRLFFSRMQLFLNDDFRQKIIESEKNSAGSANSKNNLNISPELVKIMEEAAKLAGEEKHNSIGISEMFLVMAERSEFFQKIMFDLKLEKKDIIEIMSWIKETEEIIKPHSFWTDKNFGSGIGQDWASGYTPVLNYYSMDLNQYLTTAYTGYESMTNKKYLEEMERILSKSGENNILLVGDPGIGKQSIVYEFGKKIARGETIPTLRYKHLVQLETDKLLAGDKTEVTQRLIKCFDEAVTAGNIILFINNIGNLFSASGGQIGTIDASEIILNYLKSSRIQIIGSVTTDDYQEKIATNGSIKNSFTKMDVIEPKGEELEKIVENAILLVEAKNKVFFTYQSVREIIKLSDRYIHDKPFPQKAIDVAEEAAAEVSNQGQSLVMPEIIEKVITGRTKVPVGEVKSEEKTKLLDLEAHLHQRVVGQDEAIEQIASAMRRARSGLKPKDKPIGSFLFLGPTGVGKTETAKALAESFYGSEKNMIRFDMSEFQEEKSIDLLIGSSAGKREATSSGRLTLAIRENPYSLVLFDEVEKAHPNILNLFLQMLDEGKISDAAGRVVDFSNAIIIATSNAGAEQIRTKIKEKVSAEELKKFLLDYLQTQNIFRPEFLNRFDGVIAFHPLTSEQITEVAKLMLAKVANSMLEKDVTIEFSNDAIQKLAKLGYDPVYGARPMQRVIQEKVENKLAQDLLAGKIQRGQKIIISEKDIS